MSLSEGLIEIKKLDKIDIKDALELIWQVFQEFEAPEYSQEGGENFHKYLDYNSIIKKLDNGELPFWGCFISEKLIGVIATRDKSHISMLFVLKEYHRQGIAKRLFQAVINDCSAIEGVNKITVNSSPYAVEVYHHFGFIDTNSEQTVDGIRFTPMEYKVNKDNAN